jgi:hypothetical protein
MIEKTMIAHFWSLLVAIMAIEMAIKFSSIIYVGDQIFSAMPKEIWAATNLFFNCWINAHF